MLQRGHVSSQLQSKASKAAPYPHSTLVKPFFSWVGYPGGGGGGLPAFVPNHGCLPPVGG